MPGLLSAPSAASPPRPQASAALTSGRGWRRRSTAWSSFPATQTGAAAVPATPAGALVSPPGSRGGIGGRRSRPPRGRLAMPSPPLSLSALRSPLSAARGARGARRWGTPSPGPSTTWRSGTRRVCGGLLGLLIAGWLPAAWLVGGVPSSRLPASRLIPIGSAPPPLPLPLSPPRVCRSQDCGKPYYLQNYLAFFGALRARHPHLRLIANCDMGADAPTGACGCGCVWAGGQAAAVALRVPTVAGC